MCGLKLARNLQQKANRAVTPHVGVRIETLKNALKIKSVSVTPHVGVRIETSFDILQLRAAEVTPHVGVRIETESTMHIQGKGLSHTSRRCAD